MHESIFIVRGPQQPSGGHPTAFLSIHFFLPALSISLYSSLVQEGRDLKASTTLRGLSWPFDGHCQHLRRPSSPSLSASLSLSFPLHVSLSLAFVFMLVQAWYGPVQSRIDLYYWLTDRGFDSKLANLALDKNWQ